MYTHLPSIPSSCGAAKYATYPYFIDGKFRGKAARGAPLWVDSGPDWGSGWKKHSRTSG